MAENSLTSLKSALNQALLCTTNENVERKQQYFLNWRWGWIPGQGGEGVILGGKGGWPEGGSRGGKCLAKWGLWPRGASWVGPPPTK